MCTCSSKFRILVVEFCYLIFYYCRLYLQLVQSLKQFNTGIFYPFVLSPLQCMAFELRKMIYMSL